MAAAAAPVLAAGGSGSGDLLARPFGNNTLLAQLIDANAAGSSLRFALSYVNGPSFLGRGVTDPPLSQLDSWLSSRNNRATPAAIEAHLQDLVGSTAAAVVGAPTWQALRLALADSLVATIVARVDPALRTQTLRLLLIALLLEDLAVAPPIVATAADVFQRLRWRHVLLPKELLAITPSTARLARRYGFSEYVVVRSEWYRYRAADIAHIENALAGEFRERVHIRKTETETETSETTDTERTESEERDTQTTDRLEIAEHATSDITMAVHVDGKVDVSAQYGTAKIDAHVGGSFDYSKNEARERAFTQSQETVARAVKRVEQRVRTVRSTRRLESYTETNTHRINNEKQNAVHISALYRWVEKVQRMQMFYYPHRFLLEFQVPEPAAFLLWRRAIPKGDFLNPEPPPLVALTLTGREDVNAEGKTRPLSPTDISEISYRFYVTRYRVGDVEPPPPMTLARSTSIELKLAAAGAPGGQNAYDDSREDSTAVDLVAGGEGQQSAAGISIPTGYALSSWSVAILTYSINIPQNYAGDPAADFIVSVGQDSVRAAPNQPGLAILQQAGFTLPSNRPPILESVPVTVWAQDVREFRLHMQIVCQRQQDHFVRWQQETFERIVAAYRAQEVAHKEEKAARAVGQGITIEGDSAARNAEVVREELKRAVIRLVSNGTYPPVNARTGTIDPDDGPEVSLEFAATSATEVQFIEQAFEWENMSYVLYPYYWAAKPQWKDLADIESPDPEFARFLRSGSARVVVPARPGFEDMVRTYVDLGVLWGGGPAPAVGDPEYLSVAEEIRAQTNAPRDGEPGEWWDVTLPTTLVSLDGGAQLPVTNPDLTLGPPPGP